LPVLGVVLAAADHGPRSVLHRAIERHDECLRRRVDILLAVLRRHRDDLRRLREQRLDLRYLVAEERGELRSELVQRRKVLAVLLVVGREQFRELAGPVERIALLFRDLLGGRLVALGDGAVAHDAGANERFAQHRAAVAVGLRLHRLGGLVEQRVACFSQFLVVNIDDVVAVGVAVLVHERRYDHAVVSGLALLVHVQQPRIA
jgi:hypothetical protein